MTIPDWLKTLHTEAKTKDGGRFLEKTLSGIVDFLRDIALNEDISSGKGFIQGVEPRLKVLGLASLVIAISLQKTISGILVYIAFAIVLGVFSNIPIGTIIRRVSPILAITFFIAFPATLNIVVPGKEVFTLIRLPEMLGSKVISLTEQGLMSASMLITRVTASVLWVFMITMATRPSELIKAVSFFLPRTMAMVFSISYRYIFFLIKRLEEFVLAFKSRRLSSISNEGARRWTASRMSAMFSMSLRLAKDLEISMESRGYRSERVIYRRFKPTTMDFIWIFLIIGAIIGAIV